MKDEYDSDLPVYVSLMSYEKPVANEVDGLCEIEVKDVGTIKVRGFESITDRERIETYPVTDERLSKAWKHEVYRILIKGSPKGKLEFFFA